MARSNVSKMTSVRDTRKLASAEELADHLGVPLATLYAWNHRGLGPASITVGRHLRYRWSEVETWLDSRTNERAA